MKIDFRCLIRAAVILGAAILPFSRISASLAQGPAPYIGVVRSLKTSKLGIQNPAGLAFSMNEQVFHVIESRGPSQTPPTDTDVIMITHRPVEKARTRIPAAVVDPINITFDNSYNRLLILLPSANILIQINAGPDGGLNPRTLAHFDVRSAGLQDPQGMAVDPASGDLLILDSAASSIVRLTPAPDGSFDGAAVSRVDLQYLGSAVLRGLAVNPAGGHLHVLDNTHHALYELTSAGQVIAVRDLSTFPLKDPRGMVFAPSGDQTDNPSQMSLYLADSGIGSVKRNQAATPGQIMELSLDAPLEAGASTYQSTLIRTTDLAALSPPSPDPSGLTFVSSRNSLLMSDGEVEETVSGITHFQGANVWELTLTGGVIRTANISPVAPTSVPMTDEPTGVAWNPGNGHYYFSDDNDLKVWDLNPGTDKLVGTADDSWTSFSTHGAGDDDPEGITYDSLHDRLFVADGDNREIYEYTTTGALMSHFDVLQYGVVDPESVEFDSVSGTLFVLSNAANRIIIQTTTSGALLQTIDVSSNNAVAPAGLAYAPASSGSAAKHFYIVDRGIDNNDNPSIVDGKMYEMTSPTITTGNTPPLVGAGADQTVTRSQGAHLDGSVSDDGIPGGTVSSVWSKVSGPGIVTFSDPSAPITTATFSAIGDYVLRLTGDDGELVSSDDVSITVTGDNGELALEVRVAASADDAEEDAAGYMYLTSTDLELVYEGGNQTVGMRFNGISIPKGSTIDSAYIQFTVDENQSESTALSIQGQNADQAATFTTATNNVSSRARTVAAVSWNPRSWTTVGTAGADQQTPNIASVIQEIVNRPGWSSGNSLGIIITGTGHRTARAYDYNPAQAPLLHIDYLPPTVNRAPVAVGDAYNTNEDTPLVVGAKGVLASDTDADGDALTALLNAGPSHGSLTLNPDGGFSYTPSQDFNGTDSFTYHANDAKLDSNVATVTITVTAVNDTPVANPQSVTTAEDTAKAITLTASDADNDPLTYTVVTGPGHGTLSGTAPNLSYAPAANYNGADSFTFKVNDGKVDSTPATVSITITAVNDSPVANTQSVSTAENAAVAIALTGTDVDGDPLSYGLVTSPGHGTLSGTPPAVTYTPVANYSGSDSFTFKVNDGHVDSTPATVSITITAAANHAPLADAQSATTAEDTAKAITLTASDADNDPLTYTVVTGPGHGTLGGTAPNLTYTPAADYNGADSFTFNVNDGKVDSTPATVSITITAVNDLPVANPQSATTAEDTAKAITLTAGDADNDPLTYAVVTGPGHGTLGGTAPNLTYTPAANYNGADSFTFKVNDGKVDSAPATVSITITPVNDLPVANPQSVTTAEDTAKAITLTAGDADNDPLTYAVVTEPGHGTLGGTAPNLTYTPAVNYNGADSFTFKVNDGKGDSPSATVSITVTPVNDLPVANPQSVTTAQNTPVAITLTASDADNDPLTYTVVTGPGHGTLGGTAPNLTYTPAADYNGADSFAFKVNDGKVDSAPATVSITITAAVNHAPVADPQSVTTAEDTARAITLTASDADNDPLTYTVVTGPGHGTLGGTAPNLTYTPAANYNGTDSFAFKVNDGKVDSAPATVLITITPVNDLPVANPQSVTTAQNAPVAITLTASDVDGNPLTYSLVTVPANGTLSGTAPNLTYTPVSNYSGADSFTFKVNDGTADSNVATITITVQAPVNQAPTVNAGSDQVIVYPNAAVLTGNVTDDGLPSGSLSYTWSKVSGPGAVGFTPTNGSTTSGTPFTATVTFTKAGSYTLRLTGRDGALSSTDDVIVNVRKK
jgi:VCBS repeat-containing protein